MGIDKFLLRNAKFRDAPPSSLSERFFVRSQSVVSRRIAGETLIVPVRGKVGDLASIYSFNQTGSLLWQALESPRSVAELISTLLAEYAVEHEKAEHDVTRLLNEMLSLGLVEICPKVSVAGVCSRGQQEDLLAASD